MSEWLITPIDIREDFTAEIKLPVDLTPNEAAKIARVVTAYGELRRENTAPLTDQS